MHELWALWLILAVVLGPIEVVSRRLVSAAAELGALCGALYAALGASLPVQLAVAAAVCGFGLCARRPLLRPYHRAVINWEILYRAMRTSATVTEPVDGYAGKVRYGGVNWQARSPGGTIPVGSRVKISSLLDKTTLWVYPAPGPGE